MMSQSGIDQKFKPILETFQKSLEIRPNIENNSVTETFQKKIKRPK